MSNKSILTVITCLLMVSVGVSIMSCGAIHGIKREFKTFISGLEFTDIEGITVDVKPVK